MHSSYSFTHLNCHEESANVDASGLKTSFLYFLSILGQNQLRVLIIFMIDETLFIITGIPSKRGYSLILTCMSTTNSDQFIFFVT